MRILKGKSIYLVAFLFTGAASFAPEVRTSTIARSHYSRTATALDVSISTDDVDTRSFIMSREEVNPIVSFGEDNKEKVVNLFGVWCLIVSLITGPIWMAAMKIVHRMENDENRALFDKTGKIWSKVWLTMTNSFPEITGDVDRLKSGKGPCLYVANHASWLDIPVLCTVLDPVFKFISKKELEKVPCIGTQLAGVSKSMILGSKRLTVLGTFLVGLDMAPVKV